MTGQSHLPAPRRVRATCSCATSSEDLADELVQLYALVGPANTAPRTALGHKLAERYLRSRGDLERVCWFVADHAAGVRATLRAVAADTRAATLLGPESLLILEQLDRDPFGLEASWPDDQPLTALRAFADANARPFD